MNKYTLFVLILIVLSVFDIVTTRYAISQYPELQEGNPIMSYVTSSLIMFVFIKAFGVMVIAGMYRRIQKKSAMAANIGQAIIILMMFVVVGNNLIQIGSATVSYGFPTPYGLESPGRVEQDFSQTYAFIGNNGDNATEYFTFNTTANGGLAYGAANRFYSANMVRFAVLDWVHPYRMFLVFSNLDVAYTDSFGVTYAGGYYTENVWPLTGCSNCNDLHKIGALGTLNPKLTGFVDSNGDLIIAEAASITKFVRAADYTKTTVFTASGYTSSPQGNIISDVAVDSSGNYHILVAGSAGGAQTAYLTQQTYSSTGTLIYTYQLTSDAASAPGQNYYNSDLLVELNPSNETTNIVYSYIFSRYTTVYLRYHNQTTITDICPSFCATITGESGLQIYDGYAYIASATESKIYRYPTTIKVSSGTGFLPGIGTGATEAADIIYRTSTIQSVYTNYYNTSQFLISAKVDMDSGYNLLGNNYLVNLQNYRWRIDLIDPNGVTVNQATTGACTDAWEPLNPLGRCVVTILNQYNPPSSGWQSGSWQAKLYEVANGGHVALLATSNMWNVYNGSINNNASTIGNPVEPISSVSNQATISIIDGWVGLLGFGVNSVAKFLFALLIIVMLFIIGLVYGNGNIGLALSTIPYTFFTYIGYVPKWVFIIYIIMLIIISKVFR